MATSVDSDPPENDQSSQDRGSGQVKMGRDQYPTVPLAESRPLAGDARPAHRDLDSMFEGYEITDRIGEGGVGTVWRALQLSTQRQVALKVLSTGTFGTEKARVRFEREVELTARLEHPNIARIYDSGLHHGMYYYTMELFEGEHLDKYIRNRELSQREILDLMLTICRTVQYAHQRGVVHRDLKPSNIIVTDDGRPHVLDFGLAKTMLDAEQTKVISLDGDIVGTPAFMSPEQAAGHPDAIDTRTDVYSLGIIMFNLLTDQWPYQLSGSRYAVLTTIQEQQPVRPCKIVPHFNSDLETIILKTLAKAPDERYQSVAELANDIQNWLQGLPITARAFSTLYVLGKLMVRRRTATVVAGLVLVIVLSASSISIFLARRATSALAAERAAKQAYKEIAKDKLPVANQIALLLFLELWHDNKAGRARSTAVWLDEGPQRTAALFLLDPRPLEQKQADYRERLAVRHPLFWELVTAEYHLKQGNEQAAVEAYKRCLSMDEKDSQLAAWSKKRSGIELAELSGEEVPLPSICNIKPEQ
ncbi:MAG: serine/threonine protein kinase [Planctomycetota bacterium]|jgi:hypothetical protein